MTFPEDEKPQPPISISSSRLSDEALVGVIEDFIMRSGTDYGSVEASHETKISQVKKQIQNDEVVVVYDPNTESVTLMTTRDYISTLKSISSN